MNKINTLISLVLLAWGGSGAVAAEGDKPKAAIMKASEPIVIDGKLNEKTWKTANGYQIDWIFGGKKNAKMSESPRGMVKYAWDNHYFYIAYKVNDANLITIPSERTEGPETNRRQGLITYHKEIPVDFAMMLLSLDDPIFFWEVNHNASNNFDEARITLPKKSWPLYNSTLAGKNKIVEERAVYFKDHNEIDWDTGEEKSFTLKSAVSLTKGSTVSHGKETADKDKGYTAELRIPWFSFGAPVDRKKGFNFDMNGQVIRVLIMLRNGDLPGIYHASSRLQRGFAHKQILNWQAFTLKK